MNNAAFLDAETIHLLRDKGIFIVPTLTNTYRVTTQGARGGVLDYLVATASAALPTMMTNAGRAHREGVRMAIGTDGGSWVNGHGDVATEIRLRIETGASPLEAVTMATLGSARCLGLDDSVGTLEVGKRADLIVLDGDPLSDLSALQRIRAVYKAGTPVRLDG